MYDDGAPTALLEDLDVCCSYADLEFSDSHCLGLWYPDLTPDVFVYHVGAESRSIEMAKLFASYFGERVPSVCLVLTSRDGGSFPDNRAWAEGHASDTLSCGGDEELGELMQLFGAASAPGAPRHLAVDISAASRRRLAGIIGAAARVAQQAPLTLDLLYSPVEFYEPDAESPPVEVFEPVSQDFASLRGDLDSELSLILGLGFEQDRALGAFEYLEPSNVWLFAPTGTDLRFDDAIQSANADLLEAVSRSHLLSYQIPSPVGTLSMLGSILRSSIRDRRCVIVPFGPKLFAAVAMLAALDFSPNVSVWRVSADRNELMTDRKGSGSFVGLRVTMRPNTHR